MSSPIDWFQQKGVEDIVPSVPEKMIGDILDRYQIEYYREVSFKGLRYISGYYARFDIWIPSLGVVMLMDTEGGQNLKEPTVVVEKNGKD